MLRGRGMVQQAVLVLEGLLQWLIVIPELCRRLLCRMARPHLPLQATVVAEAVKAYSRPNYQVMIAEASVYSTFGSGLHSPHLY